MTKELKIVLLRIVLGAVLVTVIVLRNPISDAASAIFIVPVMFIAVYIWLGVAFFFADLIWMAITKPEERLFAINMLSSASLVIAALGAGYWLIHDSIGMVATIIYAIGCYFVFSIIRWFRRHTASYYAALEAQEQGQSVPDPHQDKLN